MKKNLKKINLEEWSFCKIREHDFRSVCWSEFFQFYFLIPSNELGCRFLIGRYYLDKNGEWDRKRAKVEMFQVKRIFAVLEQLNFGPLKAMGLFGPMLPTLANNCNVGIVFENVGLCE